jgi:hypothetical protein
VTALRRRDAVLAVLGIRYLLLIDASGNLALADLDSGVRMPIGAPLNPSERARVTCAVWSPAGEWTAWSVDSELPEGVHELRLHDEATDSTRVLAPWLTPFYLCPSPCGRYLSHLSAGPLGLELAVSDVATDELRIIERGQPLFWSWSPDATRLAVHVEDRVIVSALDGHEARVLTEDAGSFTAPWWLPGGSVVFAADDRIVSSGPDGVLSTLVDSAASGHFALDADGRRLALVEAGDDGERLVVVDLLTGERHEVTSRPTAAFFWSPDGCRLAALVVATRIELRWIVHDDTGTVELPRFRPGRLWLAAVLPFFGQYSHSHAVWSQASDRLVVAAVDPDGRPGALVQGVEPPHAEEWLPDVDLAWWTTD